MAYGWKELRGAKKTSEETDPAANDWDILGVKTHVSQAAEPEAERRRAADNAWGAFSGTPEKTSETTETAQPESAGGQAAVSRRGASRPVGEARPAGKSRPLGEMRAARPDGVVGAAAVASAPGADGSKDIGGVPIKHLVIALFALALACAGWLFRAEVRGIVQWSAASLRGEDLPLAAKALDIAKSVRGNKPYTLDEFAAICENGDAQTVEAILLKQPEILEPRDGSSVLHVLASRPVAMNALGPVLQRFSPENVNARDSEGKTALHAAAASNAAPEFLLALRGAGADPTLRDAAGRLAIDCLIETWGGMPRAVTREEEKLFKELGHNVAQPFSRGRNGAPQTKFVSVDSRVGDVETKRYFITVAQARKALQPIGLRVAAMAVGDMIGAPLNPDAERMRTLGQDPLERLRETNREKTPALWEGLALQKGTGTAIAKVKCLLPEAYPLSLNAFSNIMAGKEGELAFETEWAGWDVPPAAQFALTMKLLQDRVDANQQKSRSGNALGSYAKQDYTRMITDSLREKGDAPGARNPLLMTLMLLEYDAEALQKERGALNLLLTPANKNAKDDKDAKSELRNLRLLHAALPKNVWGEIGPVLVAAAYTAEKRGERWGGFFMPDAYKKEGAFAYVRTWGCEDRKDSAAPLRAVLDATGKVSPNTAQAMTALVLRSGRESVARGKDGKTPLEYATENSVPAPVIAMLKAAPPYEAPKEKQHAPSKPALAGGEGIGL